MANKKWKNKMNKYIHSNSEQYFAFNIWSLESAKAIMDAASVLRHDVILQTSMKAFEKLDKRELRMFVSSYAEKKSICAYLHLDHCKKMDMIEEAVQQGWDSVMIDASDRSLDENICITNEVCSIAKPKGILVEAEVGQINGVEEDVSVTEAGIARVEDVEKFVQSTGIDMLAAAIGTAHGLYHGIPALHYELIDRIAVFTEIPLVIHGGTGLTDEMFRNLLSHRNVKKINISTDVKLAYRAGIERSIQSGYLERQGFDPLQVTGLIHDSIRDMAVDKMKLLEKA